MKHRTVFGAIGMVLLAAGCTEDPLGSLRAGPARIVVSAAVLSVNVGDSTAVTATAVDAQGNPLPDLPIATSTTPTIVSVIAGSGAPLPQARFFVKGLAFGTGNVNVVVGGVTNSITVRTYPASVVVTGQPASLGSGTTVVLTATARDAGGQAMVGVNPTAWSSDDDAVVGVAPSGATATLTGKTPGVASVTATFTGGLSAIVPILVEAGPFGGTFSASVDPAEIATATRAVGGPAFDADTRVTIDGIVTFVYGTPTADQIQFAVPAMATAGAKNILFTNMGPDQFAQGGTITYNSATVVDTYEPSNDAPGTAPTVGNGDFFFILHGDCADPGSFYGEPVNPGDECDDYFTVTNSTGAAVNVTFRVQWLSGADLDIYVLDAGGSELAGVFTLANPEVLTASIPASTTRRFRINNYDDHGAPRTLARLRVSGL